MTHPHEILVREGYAAFARGDIDALQQQFFAEDIRWQYPGRSPLGGDYAGLAQVVGWLGLTFEATGGTIRVGLHDVVANDDHVAVAGSRGRSGDATAAERPGAQPWPRRERGRGRRRSRSRTTGKRPVAATGLVGDQVPEVKPAERGLARLEATAQAGPGGRGAEHLAGLVNGLGGQDQRAWVADRR